MQVIKPFEINDSNMTSTIAEPDLTQDEAEWIQDRPNFFATNDQARGIVAIDGVIYITTHNGTDGTRVYSYDYDGNELGFFAVPSLCEAMATDGSSIFIAQYADASTANIYIYDTLGVQTGTFVVTFQQAGSAFSNSRAMCFLDGFLYMPNYGAAFSSITAFSSVDGSYINEYSADSVSGTILGIASLADGFSCVFSNGGISSVYTSDHIFSSFAFNKNVSLNGYGISGLFFDGTLYLSSPTSSLSKVVGWFSDDWIGVGAYVTGEQAIKISTHKIYQAVTNTTDDPELGVLKEPPSWEVVSATNKYRAFDFVTNLQSVAPSPFVITLTPNALFSALAVFNVIGATSVNITVNDPTDGEVYNEDIEMIDLTGIVNMWQYLFYQHKYIDKFVVDDLPPYKDATITVTFTGAGDIGVGELAYGKSKIIGRMEVGSSTDRKSYSKIAIDSFGNQTVNKVPSATYTSYAVDISTPLSQYVDDTLKEVHDEPALFIGDDVEGLKLVDLGYYERSPLVRKHTRSKINIKVRGLV